LSKADKDYFYKNFELAEYQVNFYPLFVERGHFILCESAVLCYITPNNWLTINTNKKLRKFILEQSKIAITNFYAQVFEAAAVDSSIIIFQKDLKDLNASVSLYEYNLLDGFKLIYKSSSDFFLRQKDYVINIELLKDSFTLNLLNKIEERSTELRMLQMSRLDYKPTKLEKASQFKPKR
jgi:hypothetical protein